MDALSDNNSVCVILFVEEKKNKEQQHSKVKGKTGVREEEKDIKAQWFVTTALVTITYFEER